MQNDEAIKNFIINNLRAGQSMTAIEGNLLASGIDRATIIRILKEIDMPQTVSNKNPLNGISRKTLFLGGVTIFCLIGIVMLTIIGNPAQKQTDEIHQITATQTYNHEGFSMELPVGFAPANTKTDNVEEVVFYGPDITADLAPQGKVGPAILSVQVSPALYRPTESYSKRTNITQNNEMSFQNNGMQYQYVEFTEQVEGLNATNYIAVVNVTKNGQQLSAVFSGSASFWELYKDSVATALHSLKIK